ncbi:MAG TPA: alpha/beta hydrolase [Acidimicrobiales bacterium]|nr:alpha/beta hydrolase [Acidimicrobiales bacterium]
MAAQTVPVPAADIHVEVDGPPGAPTLLLFSGARCNVGMWTPVLPALTERFRVVRHDIRGTGRSRAAEGAEYGLDRYADDAAAVLDALGIDRVLVWGMAFGTRVALAFGARHGGRTVALALYDASVEAPDAQAQRDGAAEAKARRAELGLAEVERDRSWFEHDDDATLRVSLAAAYRDPDHSRYAESLSPMPVLIATGEFDPNLGASRRLREMIPGARLEVMEAVGHGSVMQRPELCLSILFDFLDPLATTLGPAASA